MSIAPEKTQLEMGVVLTQIDWNKYLELRDEDANRKVKMTYNRGWLELMSPGRLHERMSELVARLVLEWTVENDVPIQSGGQTTLNRKDLERGLEPDKCYYIEHEAAMRARDESDLTVDPPPDLVLEVDVWSTSKVRMPIYAAMGVPEVWRWKDESLVVFRLNEDGQYVETSQSECLPGFPLDHVTELLHQRREIDETTLSRTFRQWIRDQNTD